ncbi:hypothetical protein D9611_015032 [Ephemerocybe angulata]|uniref:Uncharacterized protein n=1 Tax=Ephemerocybe angulata TaxID=980116 RepID=A0A8H5CAH3_9AGAR|nr:hypothetical protein D9611_015032 [Tulosesus angulatus]
MHNFTRPAYPCLQDGRLFLTFRRKVLPRELDISYTCLSHDNTRKCSLGTTLSLRTQPAFLRRLPCSREIDTSCIAFQAFKTARSGSPEIDLSCLRHPREHAPRIATNTTQWPALHPNLRTGFRTT